MTVLDTLNSLLLIHFKTTTLSLFVVVNLLQRLTSKSNLQPKKTTHLSNTNGALMNMATNAKLKLLNVLSVGGLLVLMER